MFRARLAMVLFCLLSGQFLGAAQKVDKANGEIRGRLLDFYGNPWKEGLVKIHSIELTYKVPEINREAKPNAEGEYEFKSLPEGRYEITAYGGFGIITESVITTIISSHDVYEANFGMEVGLLDDCVPKQIYGAIKDSHGKIIKNAAIVMMNAFKQRYQRETKSSQYGEYVLNVCLGGQYVIYAYAPGYEMQATQITIRATPITPFGKEIDFRLSKLAD